MTEPPRRKHMEVLIEALDLAGARVVDIGCGDGGLVRAMTRNGARAIGIEPSQNQLARAREADRVDNETYLCGVGEALPLAEACLDVAVFFNSLHHVPVEAQAPALAEAGRALRSGGLLYVIEPIAEGRYFEVVRPIEDETHVRAKAYEALRSAGGGPLFTEQREDRYLAPVRYTSFAAFRDHLIAVDERRRAAVEAGETRLRTAFEAAAERRDDAYVFDQPCRLNLLRRRS